MRILIVAVFSIIAVTFSALPVAHGVHHDHGGLSVTAAMHESGSDGHHDAGSMGGGSMGGEDYGALPGHCSYAAVMLEAETVAALYPTDISTVSLDDRLKPKHRPEAELRPPRV